MALEFGADRVIAKPASIALLMATLNEVISQPQKSSHKINPELELLEVTRHYNSRLIQKLEKNHLELRLAQRELAKSERRFRALIENDFDAITLRDSDGIVLYQSPATERIIGYTADETKGRPAADFLHPDDIENVLSRTAEAMRHPGKPILGITRMRHKDGHYIWTEGTTTNMLADENVNAIVGNFRDITQRKLAENKIETNEKKFRALIENNFDAISLHNEKMDILYQSPATERILGYTLEETKGKDAVAFFHPDDVPDILKRMEAVFMNPGQPIYGVYRMRHKDGHYIWVEGTTTNLLADENVNAIVGNFRDITETVNKRKQIEFDHNNLHALINNTLDLMWSVDREYKLITSNKAFNEILLHLTGTPPSKGDNMLLRGVSEDQSAKYRTLYDQAFSGEIFKITEYTDTPTPLWSELSFYPIHEDDKIIGTACYSHNITERKLATDKIAKNEKRLEAEQKKINDLFLQAPSCICILRGESHIYEMANPLYLEMTGKKDIIGKTAAEVFPELIEQGFLGLLDAVYKTGTPISGNEVFIQIDNLGNGVLTDHYMNFVYQPYKDHEGVTEGIFFFANLVTEQVMARKKIEQHEEKLIKANRLYAFISQINQTIVHITEESELYEVACRIAVEVGKYKIAWIGLADTEAKKINLVATAGMNNEQLLLFQSNRYENGGPQDRIIRNGSCYVCNDIENELEPESWKPFAAKQQLRSCMVLPIKKSGKPFATFNIYSSETNLFDEQEIALLEEVAGDISFAVDVFEKEKHRKQLENNLQHSELRLKQAQAIAHFGSWELTFSTGVALWSDEACRIYGFPLDQNIQTYESWLSYVHPDDLGYVLKVTKEAQGTLSSSAFHHRIIRPDGSVRHIYSQAQFEFNSEGKPVGLTGVAHDETEMKEAEKSLAQSEENLRLIMDLIPQSIFAKDAGGKFVFTNKSFAALYGVEPRDLVNKTAWDHISLKSEIASFMEEDNQVISSGKAITIRDQTFTDYSGKRFLFHTVKVPFIVAGTNKTAVLGITTDITEQKQAETERTKIIADIVQRNNDLEQFSYIVSHNLRAPVANILGLVDIMQTIGVEKNEIDEVTGFLATAANNLDNVIHDINRILELKHKLNENREIITFEALLSEVKLSIANTIVDEDAMIISDFSAVEKMTTTKSYLYSIFYNLISTHGFRLPASTPSTRAWCCRSGNSATPSQLLTSIPQH